MSQEKSHPPTRRRLERARQDGKVYKSQLLTRALVLGGVFGLLLGGAQFCWVRGALLLKWHLTDGFVEPLASCREVVLSGLLLVALLLILGAGVASLVEGMQVGISLEFRPLALRLDRLEPFAGFRRIGSSLRSVVWQLVNLCLALLFVHGFLSHAATTLAALDPFDRIEVGGAGSALLGTLVYGGVGLTVLVGGIDFLLQRRRFMKEVAMSTEEVRREHRDEEGDPLVRARRRALHEELSRREQVMRIRRSRVVVVER